LAYFQSKKDPASGQTIPPAGMTTEGVRRTSEDEVTSFSVSSE
jgi:hypothetical protein